MKNLIFLSIFLQSLFPTCSVNDVLTNCQRTDADNDGDCCTINRVPIHCDDGINCSDDICVLGNCVFVPKVCDDGNAATDDFCNESDGGCYHRGSGCVVPSDGDPCTIDTCDQDGSAFYLPINCDDGDLCTTDVCANGCVHTFITCNDGDPCTKDHCNPKDGYCVNLDTCVANPCSFDTILDPSYGNEYCKVIVCVNGDVHNTVRSCDDGDPCTDDFCAGNHCWNNPKNCDKGTGSTYCCIGGKCFYGSPCEQ